MRAVLSTHGELVIPPESYVLGPVIREYYRLSFLPWSALARIVISQFETHPEFRRTWQIDLQPVYERAMLLSRDERNLARLITLIYEEYAKAKQPSATRWGDKTPLNTFFTTELLLAFPDAQFIHMLRDGRDVVASCLAAKRYDNVGEAATRWQKSIEVSRRLERSLPTSQYMELRYETLVTEFELTVRRACEFLGVPFRAQMLEFWKHAYKLGDIHLPHLQNVRNPVSSQSIGQWRCTLSKSEQVEVSHRLGPVLDELGYNPEEPGTGSK